MQTFGQFLEQKTNEPVILGIINSLLEHNIDPLRYVYLRLVENLPPTTAATTAPQPVANPQMQALTKAVNDLVVANKANQPASQILGRIQAELKNLPATMQNTQQPAMQQPVANTPPQANTATT